MTTPPPGRDPHSLQAKLFRSHFAVMFLALAILVAVGLLVGALVSDAGPRGGRSAAGRALLVILASALTSAVLAAWIMSRRAARRITEPIQAVAVATRRMSEGNYAVRVPASDSTELTALAADANALAAELEVTETRRLQLIGDVAHELRTPLQTIEGSMEALMDGVIEPSDQVFAAIAEEAARLKRLAFDLSNLSRMEEHAMQLNRQPLDLAARVGDVVELLEHQFDAQNVSLSVEIESSPVVTADGDRFGQILTNVIGNALAHTSEGGAVTVRVGLDGDRATVHVSDTGRGMTPDQLGRIFERFYRVDERTSTGTGIGLTIARSLARAHGGDITATSPGLGKGSIFEIWLPVH